MASNGAPLPPQNLEAEESVLGAMMVSETVIDPVIHEVRLEPEDFYRDRHGKIFEAIRSLYGNGEPIDALTVSEELLGMGALESVGGKERVASLASNTPAPGNAAHYAQIVRHNSMLRRLLAAGQTIQQSVHGRDGDPRDLVEQAEKLLFSVAHKHTASDFHELGDILVHETDRLEKLSKGELQLTGTPSGYRKLDEITGGFQPGNLIILAARPAMGKSSLVCNIAENVAWKAKKPVAFFSLEMSETELAHRFIASRAAIHGDRLRKGQVSKDWNKVVKACNELTEAPLWIDDSSDLSLLELRAKSRRLHSSTGGLGLIIVDYIQLMRADDPRAGRVEQVGQMSRGLKILARELEVPVIGISQLSRAPEQRKPSIPQLSDLRESGCLVGSSRVFLPEDGTYQRIDEIVSRGGQPGAKVLALNTETWKLEPRDVTNAFSTGRKRVFELSTRLGRRIEATANHKFLTIDGWRRLDQLEPGTQLALPSETSDCPISLGMGWSNGQSRAARTDASPPGRGDIAWDRLSAVEGRGVEEVYDLTVDGLHNFVAEDIVVHNSIEQDADIVAFIYREEYYEKEESERPGEADLIIAKHRNGPIGDVPLAFQAQYPRFLSLAAGGMERGDGITRAPSADVA